MAAALVVASVAAQFAWLSRGFPALADVRVNLLVVVALFALADKFVVVLPVRRGSHTLSLSEIPLVLGLVMIHPVLLFVARIAGAILGLGVLDRQRGSKLAFNVALFGAQAALASAVFHLAVGSRDPLGPVGWVAAFGAAFVVDLVSIVLVTAAIAIHEDGQEWRRLLTADVRSLFQVPLVAVTTTLALVTAIVVRDHPGALVLLGVLAFVAYRAFREYARQTQGHKQVEQLYAFTRTLDGVHDSDEVTRTVLSEVRDLVRAESAELVVMNPDAGGATWIRLSGQGDVELHTGAPTPGQWWEPAMVGTPVLRQATPRRGADDGPRDGMAVPVNLDQSTGVLIVTDSLSDAPTFPPEHLRLMEALAAHAGVALTNTRLVDRLRYIGSHDALTDLPNRRQLRDQVQCAVEALADSDGIAAVLMLDLDRFKEVNDALGHDIGDDLLREVGRRLQATLGERGTVARLGGDEFAVLIPHAADQDDVLALGNELHRTVERPVPVGDLTLTAQASIGVCFAPEHGRDADRLLQRADVAMYAAKQARSGVRVYRPQDDQDAPRRLALMTALRVAVHDRLLVVAYQPKVDLRTGRVVGAEALVRWHHDGSRISPDEFIPLAERSGLIRPLTHLVLDTALAGCADWRRAGQAIGVAVNLSPLVLTDPSLVIAVKAALRRSGTPASALTLELTENGVMEDPVRSLATLAGLHAIGVKLSIDDFGTGHSSLGRLAELPIHEVKIDKSFVHGLTVDAGRRAVTDASVQLGRTLGLTVVAEGVEEEAEYEYLQRLGCDVVQGYLVSEPLLGDDFLDWLLRREQAVSSELAQSASVQR
jgi:diguanylate cyclase (GGDEF)-like protein